MKGQIDCLLMMETPNGYRGTIFTLLALMGWRTGGAYHANGEQERFWA